MTEIILPPPNPRLSPFAKGEKGGFRGRRGACGIEVENEITFFHRRSINSGPRRILVPRFLRSFLDRTSERRICVLDGLDPAVSQLGPEPGRRAQDLPRVCGADQSGRAEVQTLRTRIQELRIGDSERRKRRSKVFHSPSAIPYPQFPTEALSRERDRGRG